MTDLLAVDRRLRDLERAEPYGGTSFPSSPVTNAPFYRTDLGWWCYYDGARWLTVHEWSATIPVVTTSTAGAAGAAPWRSELGGVYVTRIAQMYVVATTNNGTNYWTITLRSLNSSYGGGSTIHTYNTSAKAANVWTIEDGAPSTLNIPVEKNGFDINVAKTAGAPGALSIGMTVYYRLIVT